MTELHLSLLDPVAEAALLQKFLKPSFILSRFGVFLGVLWF